VNWRLAPTEIAYIVDHTQARILVTSVEYVNALEEIEEQLPEVELILVLGRAQHFRSYEDWLGEAPAIGSIGSPSPDDVAIQMYTSGTTGPPKGAMLTHRNLLGTMAAQSSMWSYDADSVSLVPMPLFHIGGTATMLLSMVPGGTTVLMPAVDPARIIKMIAEYRVTNTLLVPAIIQLVLDVPGAADADWSSLRTLLYGAAPISDALLVRAMKTMKCQFIHLYGLTEHSGNVTWLDSQYHDPEHRPNLLRSCGKPSPWVKVRGVDPTTKHDVPTGEVGEIWVRSVQVMAGYWRDPEATASAITSDGWLRTGDAGYFDEAGFLYLHDRIKDMIVSGGENIYPAEIENVLADHPHIADVAVIGVPSDRWGETAKAIIVPRAGKVVREEEVIGFCRARLARYKCPTSIKVVDKLPRNPSGKLLKRELREPYWADHDRRVH
jgi:long-chain acyl-CoA synthetase